MHTQTYAHTHVRHTRYAHVHMLSVFSLSLSLSLSLALLFRSLSSLLCLFLSFLLAVSLFSLLSPPFRKGVPCTAQPWRQSVHPDAHRYVGERVVEAEAERVGGMNGWKKVDAGRERGRERAREHGEKAREGGGEGVIACWRVRRQTCSHIHIHVRTNVCICYIYTHTCTHMHMHTHTHTTHTHRVA